MLWDDFLNSKVNAFQDVLNSRIYIDKTGLLEYTNSVIDTTSKFICNSRPRRFGKSITADMLTAYYSRSLDTEEIFEKLEVGKTADFRKHLNQYDVIHIDIQWCIEPAGGADQVITFINKNVIEELRETYEKELSEGTSSLPDALSQISAKTGKKFILILDEWDVLIRDEAANQKIQDEYINFLRGLFKGTEPSKYIHLAYLTGNPADQKNKDTVCTEQFFRIYNAGCESFCKIHWFYRRRSAGALSDIQQRF